MNKLGITIVKNTGFFSVGFYPDEKTINFSNVIEVIKTVFNEDDTPFYYGESKIDPSEKDYIEYISEYEPEDLEQEIIETKVFDSEDERNSFFDNYEF